jgi:hypothetical protein
MHAADFHEGRHTITKISRISRIIYKLGFGDELLLRLEFSPFIYIYIAHALNSTLNSQKQWLKACFKQVYVMTTNRAWRAKIKEICLYFTQFYTILGILHCSNLWNIHLRVAQRLCFTTSQSKNLHRVYKSLRFSKCDWPKFSKCANIFIPRVWVW